MTEPPAPQPQPTSDEHDWNLAPPERVPQPTYWPAALSLGATLALWGLISSFLLVVAGGLLSVLALAGWIRDLRHERAH